jgi:hypothetical protein
MLSLSTFRRFLGGAARVAERLASPKLLTVNGLTMNVPAGQPRPDATHHHAEESGAADPAWTAFMRGM